MGTFQILSTEEQELMRRNGAILRGCLQHVASVTKPGVTTQALDDIAETYIRDHGGEPGFKGYGGYPGTLCISINDECVHGLPGKRIVKEGDIVSLDGGVILGGLNTDACITIGIGSISSEAKNLLHATKEALDRAIGVVRPGNRIGDISWTIQTCIKEFGCTPVQDLTGHGLGSQLHQYPEIPNHGKRNTGALLPVGTLIAIEPIVTTGDGRIRQLDDGWTIVTADHSLAAHFEHTVLVTEGGCEIIV